MAGNKAGGMPGLSWYYSVPDKDLKPTLKPDFSVPTRVAHLLCAVLTDSVRVAEACIILYARLGLRV